MTPNARLIKSFYTDLEYKWDRIRVDKFRKTLKVSEEELAAYMNLTPSRFRRYLKDGKLPGPALVLLDLWENYYNHVLLGEPLKQYPNPVKNHD